MNENCPCKKKKCERHGDCEACRAYHSQSKRHRPVACEKEIDAEPKVKENDGELSEDEMVAIMIAIGLF